jgi:hypothetical protein
MEFHIHMDNIERIEEKGTWVKLVLKNGVVLEDRVKNFSFNEPWVFHFDAERK